ncbi:MAG TPA: HAD family hydrolase [Bryobacteraceae bacterium]|nr:HAD family hydrolase [Bryobacteraceae bacterium]
MSSHERQHLLIDADDTLWENNIYFEQAFDEFVEYLNHASMSAVEIRAVLDEIEIANIKIHGYGAANFARNLAQCYQRLAEREIRDQDLRTVMSFAERILDRPMELMEGVTETLEYLAPRHELTLFTKGHPEEQKLKIDRSGLDVFFQHTAIVKEKNAEAYASLASERGLNSQRTWMVGNSPKSDINPALAAGLNAVYIPHPNTWGLEQEEIQHVNGRLLVLENFAGLRRHF